MILANKLRAKLHTVLFIIIIFTSTLMLSACNNTSPQAEDTTISEEETVSDIIDEENPDDTSDEILEEETGTTLTEDNYVSFNPQDTFSYCEQPLCHYNKETGLIDFSISFKSVPESDDLSIYLFEFANYDAENSFEEKSYISSVNKGKNITLSFPYSTERLFAKFVPAIIVDGTYYPLSQGQYITNPEDIANNTAPYPEIASKKGILLDPLTLDKEELTGLNVKRAVFNIPLSFIMGESENPDIPSVKYGYSGKIYNFNGYRLAGFDSVFRYLTANGYHVTAIVLNDWNKAYPEIIHPLSKRKSSKSMYYAFNTQDYDGVKTMEAAALFLADRYSGTKYGMVHDWVIANEINQQKIWNYMSTDDLDVYMESFEKSFRTFYNAIKSRYSNAVVYYSIDQNWNSNYGLNYMFFNAKDVVDMFNDLAISGGNYNWALSIHPYPSPLTNTKFWKKQYDKSESSAIVTPMNLSVVTDYMQKDNLLDTNGNVRQIGVTELGFSSKAGEKNQAAAFAYCYHIIEDNEYINSFLLNRQTDSVDSLKSGLALGLYNPDYSPKYIAEVFANIDTPAGDSYLNEMLETIGAASLEEALSWAR